MTNNHTASAPEREPRLGLAQQVFMGLGAGIVVGIFFGEEATFLGVAGDAFIALLQITVIPYIVVALIISIGRLTLADVRVLAVKGGSVLLVLWAAGLLVIFASPLAFPDWPTASFFSPSELEETQPIDFIALYIPSNPFASLSNAIVPAIVVFSILFGIGLVNANRKEALLDLLSTIAETLMSITVIVAWLAPYGVFAITANAAGTLDIGDLGRLQIYLVVYISMALILSLWVIPGLITAVTPLGYGEVVRAFRTPLITAFATGNLLIVLPILAAQSKALIGSAAEDGEHPTGREESSVDILIPAAFPFPSLGLLLTLMFVLFGGWFAGSAVSVADYPTLAFAGLASLFGGPVLALPFLFDMLRLPANLFQIFITLDVMASRFGTLLGAMHIIAIALIGTYAMDKALTIRPLLLIRFAMVSIALVATALIGIRGFYTSVYVQPYTQDRAFVALRLMEEARPHTVYRVPPQAILDEGGTSPGLAGIRARGVLRACYEPGDYPSSFLNADGELVGFDIELTHRFARDLGVRVAFMPVRSGEEAGKRVRTSYCDVLMSLRPIRPSETEDFALTAPVLNAPVGLVVLDHRRHAFRTWAGTREMAGLRVALQDERVARGALDGFLPDAKPVLYRDNEELDALMAAGAPGVDAILQWPHEGAAWTVRYPAFSLVVPTPAQIVPFGYAVGHGNEALLRNLDTWLLNARLSGVVDRLYAFWMLGRFEETKPPRWSVIRNVLGWVE